MYVSGIVNYKYHTLSFERRPDKNEEKDMHKTINSAYKLMGTKERIAITHGACFPASLYDSKAGSPFGKAAREYIKFLALYGFNGNQLGPNGQLEKGKYSPYNSSAFAKNRLFIDLEKLTEKEYGSLLSESYIKSITKTPESNGKNYTFSDFDEAGVIYDKALAKAFKTFTNNLKDKQPDAVKLHKEFTDFLRANNGKNNLRLTEEGIFNVLSEKYGSEDFEAWKNKQDGYLIVNCRKGNKKAVDRFNQIYNDNKQKIDLYKFEQFIIEKQIKENKEFREKLNFKYIGDMLVGCSKMDYWRYRDAFVPGYQLGAAENGRNPQLWKIPVLNPRKLFKGSDMQLNTAGKFLKEKIDNILDYCENVRVDHVMGLIEPYVIANSSIIYDENGKVINTPENPVKSNYMSNMTTEKGVPLDDFKNYSCDFRHENGYVTYHSNIMNKIVLPALKEHNLDKNDPIWEDICSQPEKFSKVFYENLGLPGIVQLEWSKAQDKSENNWFLVGSHDSIPAMNMIKREWTKNSEAWHPGYLAWFLNIDLSSKDKRNDFEEKLKNDERTCQG